MNIEVSSIIVVRTSFSVKHELLFFNCRSKINYEEKLKFLCKIYTKSLVPNASTTNCFPNVWNFPANKCGH